MTSDPQLLRRYLLGAASDSERDAVEHAYFDRDEVRSEVEDAEDTLIESYLDATLSTGERAAFEHTYLASPVHRRRVDVARTLRSAAHRHRPIAWSRYGLAAAAVLVVALAGLAWVTRNRPQPPADVPAVAETPPPGPATPAPSPRQPIVVALAVPPVTVRGPGGPPTARVPADAERLAITLQAEPARPLPASVLVIVETAEGIEAWQGNAVTVDDGLRVSIPIDRVPAGDYVARVIDPARNGFEIGQYFFRVQRAPAP